MFKLNYLVDTESMKLQKIFESYMSPGAVTEIVYFFVGEYDDEMKVGEGGGLDEEQENIQVMELNFEEAFSMLLQYAKINGLLY